MLNVWRGPHFGDCQMTRLCDSTQESRDHVSGDSCPCLPNIVFAQELEIAKMMLSSLCRGILKF